MAGRLTCTQSLDLALIGNSCAAALVDGNTRIVWWCFPHFNSNPVSSRLLAGEALSRRPRIADSRCVQRHSRALQAIDFAVCGP